MNRRRFIHDLSSALLLVQGTTLSAFTHPLLHGKRRLLRFAVGSDTHFGQADTGFRDMLETGVHNMNGMHARTPFDFGVINGDIVHDDISHFGAAKSVLDGLSFRYYVTQGNHDHATPEEWEAAWGMPVNFTVTRGKTALIFATTSNKQGKYLPPDLAWLEQQFQKHEKARHILLFIHIPPINWTAHAISSPGFEALVKKQGNLRAVFHGHEHDQDGIKWKDGIPYLFDSHLGGSWGTKYRGYRIVELYNDGSMLTWIQDPGEAINRAEINADGRKPAGA